MAPCHTPRQWNFRMSPITTPWIWMSPSFTRMGRMRGLAGRSSMRGPRRWYCLMVALSLDDDDVALADAVVHHAVPHHPEGEVVVAPQQRLGHLDGLGVVDRLDRAPGGDAPEERHLDLHRPRVDQLEGALAVPPGAADDPLLFQLLEVLLDRVVRAEPERLADLLVRGGHALVGDEAPDVVVDRLLLFG